MGQIQDKIYVSGDFSFTHTTASDGSTTLIVTAANVSAFVGTGFGTTAETGVKLINGLFGLVITTPVSGPATYALYAQGGVNLELPNTNLANNFQTTLYVQVNTNTTTDATITFPSGSTLASVTIPKNTSLSFGGALQLTIGGFNLSGNFGFSETSTPDANNPNQTDTTILIGANNVTAGLMAGASASTSAAAVSGWPSSRRQGLPPPTPSM